MYRRVVLSSPTATTGNIDILYRVRGAMPLSQHRRAIGAYEGVAGTYQTLCAVVFDDAVRLQTPSKLAANRTYEFIIDVAENQPVAEYVEEVSSEGIIISVYNADGVLVCDNSGNRKPAQSGGMTSVPGEMTSVPGEEPGEMAGETTDEPGAMI